MAIYNRDELLSNFSGDEDILKDLIEEFVLKSNDLLQDVEEAIKVKNADLLRLHAHTLKGVVSNFYAEEMRLIAYDLENAGATKNFADVEVKFSKIKVLMNELIKELNELNNTL